MPILQAVFGEFEGRGDDNQASAFRRTRAADKEDRVAAWRREQPK